MLSVGTAVTVGVVTNTKKDKVSKFSGSDPYVQKRVEDRYQPGGGARWRLIGMGVLGE